MARAASTSVIRHFEALFEGRSVAGLTDRQLLERFTAGRGIGGEEAFAALVQRHGPMVLGLCRQLLLDEHHAEDVFQAVFLVLARKAESIREPELLGNWLYGVALRAARNARRRLARRRRNEGAGALRRPGPCSGRNDEVEVVGTPAEEASLAREHADALHAEIDRLPRSFQLPIVLCYFEGLTIEEASRRLQWPVGTVSSRLARARVKLRSGLAARGVVSAVVVTAVLIPRFTWASVSEPLREITVRAAIDFAAVTASSSLVSSVASALARELLRSTSVQKLRFFITTVLLVGVVAAVSGLSSQSSSSNADPANPLAAHRPAPASKQAAESPAPARMRVVGRVLDPNGQPVAHGTVELVSRPRRVLTRGNWNGTHVLIGRGDTDSGGRFRVDALRTSSSRFHALYALVKSTVTGWAELDLDAAQPAAEIRLRSEQVIRGRLVDVNGQAVPGAELRVLGFGLAGGASRKAHVYLEDKSPEALRTWPDPVKTDDNGRFVLRGVGRGLYVHVVVDDPRFGRQVLEVTSDDLMGPLDVTLTLKPAKSIEGRVIAADTRQPVVGTLISAGSSVVHADAEGRYRAISAGDLISVHAYPPAGEPYLIAAVDVAWNKGMVKQQLDIALRRGVLMLGRVTEQGTGRPLEGASVMFVPVNGPAGVESKWQSTVPSQSDGSFRIVVPQGKGHLLVFGPTSDYIHTVIGSRTLMNGQPGGERWYAHCIVPFEVKQGDSSRALDAELRPGKSIRGRLVDGLGQPVLDAMIITRLHIEPTNPFWRGEWSDEHRARDGHFELHGLDPKRPALVYFLDTEHELGAAVELTGEQSDKEVTIRLEPGGQAKARFVRPDGQPFANFFPGLELALKRINAEASGSRGEASRGTASCGGSPRHWRRGV